MAASASAAAVARALGYPYPRPARSFLFVVGSGSFAEVVRWPLHRPSCPGQSTAVATVEATASGNTVAAELECFGELQRTVVRASGGEEQLGAEFLTSAGVPSEQGFGNLHERVPCIAYGSNASPEQLLRKYPQAPPSSAPAQEHVIPVLKATIKHFDVVYAAYISSYGSVPAALQHSQGTECEVFVTFLTRTQLLRMHETEGGYDFVKFPCSLRLFPADEAPFDVNWCCKYRSSAGCLTSDNSGKPGKQVALSEVPATDRRFDSKTQTEVQITINALTGRRESVEQVVLLRVQNDQQRLKDVEVLKTHGTSVEVGDLPSDEALHLDADATGNVA